MTENEWLEQQQRAHNHRSYKYELPPVQPKRMKRHTFTLEQLEAGERWAEKQLQRAEQ